MRFGGSAHIGDKVDLVLWARIAMVGAKTLEESQNPMW